MNNVKLVLLLLFFLFSLSFSEPLKTGGRSRSSIMNIVMKNVNDLKRAYNNRIFKVDDLWGKITIKFAIDEFGKVIFSKVVSSTVNDIKLEKTCDSIVATWEFGRIHKPGDVTEVVYPFVFVTSQSNEDVKIKDIEHTLSGPRTAKSIEKTFSTNENRFKKLCSETKSLKPSSTLYTMLSVDYLGNVINVEIEYEDKKDSVFIVDFREVLKAIKFKREFGSKENTSFKYVFHFDKYIRECSENK